MIYLHRTPNCNLADKIEAELRRLVVAHKVVFDGDQNPSLNTLPAIHENDAVIIGKKNIDNYLKELENFAFEWRKFQTDACYIDEDGNVC